MGEMGREKGGGQEGGAGKEGAGGGRGSGWEEGRREGRRREGGKGGGVEVRGRGGRRKFYLGAELIKCINPNEGEPLRGWGRGGREGGEGRAGGGREWKGGAQGMEANCIGAGGRIDQTY